MNLVRLFIFAALLCSCLALECHSGQSVIGLDIGKSTETCKNPDDYCFNATISAANIKKYGCTSSSQCSLIENDCITKEFEGYAGVKFCCCNTGDLCNSISTITFSFPLLLMATLWCL